MEQVGAPLGWSSAVVPPAPKFGKEIYASFNVRYQNKRVKCTGGYAYRSAAYLSDDCAAHDDRLFFRFDVRDSAINYQQLLRKNAPEVIEAFGAYRADLCFFLYEVFFEQKNAGVLQRLRSDASIDIDGRNNIFTLQAVNYWDGELCQRALGYGRDEVIRRLTGKVPRVEPLMDGVYVVFSDNPDLTFEEYCAYNDALKPVLGLV
ncbi:hypothetical protein [Dongia mobilis]|nr:hypothetical protein [Dongia mobilis]